MTVGVVVITMPRRSGHVADPVIAVVTVTLSGLCTSLDTLTHLAHPRWQPLL